LRCTGVADQQLHTQHERWDTARPAHLPSSHRRNRFGSVQHVSHPVPRINLRGSLLCFLEQCRLRVENKGEQSARIFTSTDVTPGFSFSFEIREIYGRVLCGGRFTEVSHDTTQPIARTTGQHIREETVRLCLKHTVLTSPHLGDTTGAQEEGSRT